MLVWQYCENISFLWINAEKYLNLIVTKNIEDGMRDFANMWFF
jgi:hypothetical protein